MRVLATFLANLAGQHDVSRTATRPTVYRFSRQPDGTYREDEI